MAVSRRTHQSLLLLCRSSAFGEKKELSIARRRYIKPGVKETAESIELINLKGYLFQEKMRTITSKNRKSSI